jgi:hypothetical protein
MQKMWKQIVDHKISCYANDKYKARIENDTDFSIYGKVMPQIFPSPLWMTATVIPGSLHKLYIMILALVSSRAPEL